MKINSKVVSDKFDDEVVVVNLETGFYYSFKSTAMLIWRQIEQGFAKEQIINSFNFLTETQTIDLDNFINQLIEENLVTDLDNEEVKKNTQIEPTQFTSIEFSKFDDMADLIMIDPIHDADENKGWPNMAE